MGESPFFSFVKLLIFMAIAFFMGMLYWSSSLIEHDIKGLRSDIKRLEENLEQVSSRPVTFNSEPAFTSLKADASADLAVIEEKGNLLSIDPFYQKTFPDLLGPGFRPHGTRHEATIGEPEHLHPFANWSNVSSWWSLCTVTLAQNHFGKFETMAPNMALRIEEHYPEGSNVPEYWVVLRDNVYWHPLNKEHFGDDFELADHFFQRHQVTAHDFKFYWDAIMNPFVQEAGAAALRNYLGDIREIEVVDDLTFVVRWNTHTVQTDQGDVEKVKYIAKQLTGGLRPLARWVYQYLSDGTKIVEESEQEDTYRTNSVWAQNFSQHWARSVIVGCGAWMFDGMTDEQIAFVRNPHHFEPLAVLVDRLEIRFKETPDAVWQDFKAGKIDTYSLQPKQLVELEAFLSSEEYAEQKEQGLGIERIDYLARSYSYVGWNQATPYFSSQKVRQAMTMAIDRDRIIEQYVNHMGIPITGPFFYNSPSYDKSISKWPYDVRRAKRLLEEEGWYDSDGDGVVDKEIDGVRVPFRFGLTYYVKNPVTKANSEYIATALREIGVDAQLNGVDIADLSSQFDEKSFDAIYLGWALGSPPEEPKQLWHSSGAAEKGSSNAVGFASKEADALISALQYEYDIDQRNAMYHRFHQIIHDEAPYTFLYSPKTTLLYRGYVKNVFIPSERQDLIPGANVSSPDSSVFYLEKGD